MRRGAYNIDKKGEKIEKLLFAEHITIKKYLDEKRMVDVECSMCVCWNQVCE
jgi:hypothetical protein